jgi:hypothetical protein
MLDTKKVVDKIHYFLIIELNIKSFVREVGGVWGFVSLGVTMDQMYIPTNIVLYRNLNLYKSKIQKFIH